MVHVYQSATVEAYFDAQSEATVTSDRTLAKLAMPRMDQQTLTMALQGVDIGLATERAQLTDYYAGQFDKWMYWLR